MPWFVGHEKLWSLVCKSSTISILKGALTCRARGGEGKVPVTDLGELVTTLRKPHQGIRDRWHSGHSSVR